MEALQSGGSPQKNNGGKVNVCLVETPEQLVAFGHEGLRSTLGQNAVGPPFIGFICTVSVCRGTAGCSTDACSTFFQISSVIASVHVILEADNIGFVHVGNQAARIIYL